MKFQELPNDPKTVDTEKDNKLSYKWKIIDQENCVFPAFRGKKSSLMLEMRKVSLKYILTVRQMQSMMVYVVNINHLPSHLLSSFLFPEDRTLIWGSKGSKEVNSTLYFRDGTHSPAQFNN